MIETLIVLWFLKTIFEVVGEVAVKETALLKGKDVEFRNGRRFRGRGRGALWGTLTNAAGEVWRTNWDARRDLRTEKARVKADRSAERFREREERRSARRGGADQTGGPELEIPDWVNGAAADRSAPSEPSRSADREPSGPVPAPSADQDGSTAAGPDDADRQTGPSGPEQGSDPADRPAGTTAPDPTTTEQPPDQTSPPPAEPPRPTLTLIKNDTEIQIPKPPAPPRIIEGDTVHSGETNNLDALAKFLDDLGIYFGQVLARLETADSALTQTGLTDPGVRTPLTGIAEKVRGARVDIGNATTGLTPHRNVGEAVGATTGAAQNTDFYQPV